MSKADADKASPLILPAPNTKGDENAAAFAILAFYFLLLPVGRAADYSGTDDSSGGIENDFDERARRILQSAGGSSVGTTSNFDSSARTVVVITRSEFSSSAA